MEWPHEQSAGWESSTECRSREFVSSIACCVWQTLIPYPLIFRFFREMEKVTRRSTGDVTANLGELGCSCLLDWIASDLSNSWLGDNVGYGSDRGRWLVWSSSVTRLIVRSASVLLDCTLCWLLPAPFFYRWPESTLSILDVHSIFTTCNYENKVAISEASLAVRSWTMMIMSFFLLEGRRAESPYFLHVEFRCCKFHFSQTFVLFAFLILHFRLLLSLSLVILPWGALLVSVEVPSGYYQRGHGLNHHLPWFSSFV